MSSPSPTRPTGACSKVRRFRLDSPTSFMFFVVLHIVGRERAHRRSSPFLWRRPVSIRPSYLIRFGYLWPDLRSCCFFLSATLVALRVVTVKANAKVSTKPKKTRKTRDGPESSGNRRRRNRTEIETVAGGTVSSRRRPPRF